MQQPTADGTDAASAALSAASGEAYPQELAARESVLVAARREKAGLGADEPLVGLALSGGGIRSATFCLGVLQALARGDLLRRIDFLSTVSGGGYIGSFLTALHLRDGVTPDKVRDILAPADEAGDAAASPPGTLTSRSVLGWLRENGRHLAPNGTGDLFTAGAVILRNWVAVQFVIMLMVLMLFTLMQSLRAWLESDLGGEGLMQLQGPLQQALPFGDSLLWWSPISVLPALLLVFAVVPVGWAYWLVGLPRYSSLERIAPWVTVVMMIASVAVLRGSHLISEGTGYALYAVCGITLLVAVAALLLPRGSRRRRRLSEYLRNVLVLAGIVTLVALVDTLGQSAYLFSTLPDHGISRWLGDAAAVIGGLLAAGAAAARRITVAMSGTSAMSRPGLPKSLLAGIGALIIYGLFFTGMNGLSHAAAWGLKVPASAPIVLTDPDWSDDLARPLCVPVCSPGIGAKSDVTAGCACTPRGEAEPWPMLWWTSFLLLLSIVVSWSWSFLNLSTLLPLYTARLVRAYLGASNPDRVCPTGESGEAVPPVTVTQVLIDDDPTRDTWIRRAGWPLHGAPAAGGPLHLVNVTVNETVSGRSQVQQNDRRGVGLAAGPAGMSAGREHHAVLFGEQPDRRLQALVFPPDRADGSRPFRMFEFPPLSDHPLMRQLRMLRATIRGMMQGDAAAQRQAVAARRTDAAADSGDAGAQSTPSNLREMTAELVSLSYWMGVSGAAFSTGLGYRTRLSLSLLAGFFNVRLGYWWDSGVDPADRGEAQNSRKSWLGRTFTHFFPVQSLLLDEFIARYHGPSRRWWYMSDGGHFENMGAYELIRRRLPVIIIVDAEADPDYRFEGLANLVRKARIDFGAEVRFLEVEEIDRYAANAAAGMTVTRRVLGSLDMLRRCNWETARIVVERGATPVERSVPGASQRESMSLAHAAIGIITYPDSQQQSRIIHIKPTLTGGEPRDIRHYHATEPDFPQQTTADQFFDESQWESYRKLGEHIGLEVFANGINPCPLPARRGSRADG